MSKLTVSINTLKQFTTLVLLGSNKRIRAENF